MAEERPLVPLLSVPENKDRICDDCFRPVELMAIDRRSRDGFSYFGKSQPRMEEEVEKWVCTFCRKEFYLYPEHYELAMKYRDKIKNGGQVTRDYRLGFSEPPLTATFRFPGKDGERHGPRAEIRRKNGRGRT